MANSGTAIDEGGNISSEMTDKVVVTVKGNDYTYTYEQLGVTFDSPEIEVLSAVNGILREAESVSIEDSEDPGNFIYGVRKSTNTRMTYVYPKDPLG